MKKVLYALSFLSFIAVSCDSKDEAQEIIGEIIDPTDLVYFPLDQGNDWTYDITIDDVANGQDMFFIDGTVTVNGLTYTDITASAQLNAFMTTFFDSGALRKDDTILNYSGTLEIPFDINNTIQVDIPTLAIYDSAALSGTILSEFDQTISQDINGFPVTLDFTVRSTNLGIRNDVLTINGTDYSDILESSLEVELTVSTSIAGIPVTLLPTQNIIQATNSYAAGIGFIDSVLDFQYEFVDLSPFGITLPFPTEVDRTTLQTIASFTVPLN